MLLYLLTESAPVTLQEGEAPDFHVSGDDNETVSSRVQLALKPGTFAKHFWQSMCSVPCPDWPSTGWWQTDIQGTGNHRHRYEGIEVS